MNCWIETGLLHSGRCRYSWNAGGKPIIGFVCTVRWAIDRPHRKPSCSNAPDSHCGGYDHRGQVSFITILLTEQPTRVQG